MSSRRLIVGQLIALRSCLSDPDLTLPYPTSPHLTLPYVILYFLILSYITLPCLTLPYLTSSYLLPCLASLPGFLAPFNFPGWQGRIPRRIPQLHALLPGLRRCQGWHWPQHCPGRGKGGGGSCGGSDEREAVARGPHTHVSHWEPWQGEHEQDQPFVGPRGTAPYSTVVQH